MSVREVGRTPLRDSYRSSRINCIDNARTRGMRKGLVSFGWIRRACCWCQTMPGSCTSGPTNRGAAHGQRLLLRLRVSPCRPVLGVRMNIEDVQRTGTVTASVHAISFSHHGRKSLPGMVRLCRCCPQPSSNSSTSSNSPGPVGPPLDPRSSGCLLRSGKCPAVRRKPAGSDGHHGACHPRCRSRCPCRRSVRK